VDAPRGAGRVVFTAFSLSEFSRSVRDKADRDFVGRILARAPRAAEPPAQSVFLGGAADIAAGEDNGNGAWLSTLDDQDLLPVLDGGALRNEIDRHMREGLVVRFPPVLKIAGLLALYFLLAVPVNYLVWHRSQRLEFAWATAAVLAVGFGLLYYMWGYMSGGTVLTGETVTVVETRSGTDAGRYRSFHSLYSPGHTSGDLRLKPADGFGRGEPFLSRLRITQTDRNVRALDYFIRWDDPVCLFEDFEIYPRAVRTFEAEGTCSVGGGLILDRRENVLTVVNKTPWTFSRVEWSGQGGVATEPLKPGESVRLQRSRGGGGGPAPPHVLRWMPLLSADRFVLPTQRSLMWRTSDSDKYYDRLKIDFLLAYVDAGTLTPDVKGATVAMRNTLVVLVPVE
jgi:hypothetical protein